MAVDVDLLHASGFSLEDLARLVARAFADYPYGAPAGGPDALGRRCAVEGLDLHLSVVARMGAEPVGLVLLGRRSGALRVGLMGVVPEARRCGAARELLARAETLARAHGDARLELECFASNRPALSLYREAGFVRVRDLPAFRAERVAAADDAALVETDAADVARAVDANGFDDLPVQASAATLAQLGPPLRAFALGPARALVHAPEAGPVGLRALVVERDARRRGAARALLGAVAARVGERPWRVVAIAPEECGPALARLGFDREPEHQEQLRRVLGTDRREGGAPRDVPWSSSPLTPRSPP